MSGDFNISEESEADNKLKRYEELINKLPQGDPVQKFIKHMMIPWKLKARRWAKKSQPIPIEINEVHRNEQINIAAICAGHQITMCDNEMYNTYNTKEYYLLVPMKGIETPFGIYKRNDFGEGFQERSNNEWGKEFERFPCKYVVKVIRRPLVAINVQEFWEELVTEGLFDFWDPKGGPVKWCQDHPKPHIPILRAFEINKDLRPLIEYKKARGWPPYLTQTGIEALATPILTNEEFDPELQRLLVIFGRYRLL